MLNKIKDLQKPFWINELRKTQWNQELSETHGKTQWNQELTEMCSGIIELGGIARNRLRRALEPAQEGSGTGSGGLWNSLKDKGKITGTNLDPHASTTSRH